MPLGGEESDGEEAVAAGLEENAGAGGRIQAHHRELRPAAAAGAFDALDDRPDGGDGGDAAATVSPPRSDFGGDAHQRRPPRGGAAGGGGEEEGGGPRPTPT